MTDPLVPLAVRIGRMSAVPVEVYGGFDPNLYRASIIGIGPETSLRQVHAPGVANSLWSSERCRASLVRVEPGKKTAVDARLDWSIDVLTLAHEFEGISDPTEAVAYLNRWGNFFHEETDDDHPYQLDRPYEEMIRWSTFQLWQRWFRGIRTGGWLPKGREGFYDVDPSLPSLRELFPEPRDRGRLREKHRVLIPRRNVILIDQPANAREPLVLHINSESITDALGAVVYAERLTGFTRKLCPNCGATFLPSGKAKKFCNTNCGLLFHKRKWAREERDRKLPKRKRKN